LKYSQGENLPFQFKTIVDQHRLGRRSWLTLQWFGQKSWERFVAGGPQQREIE